MAQPTNKLYVTWIAIVMFIVFIFYSFLVGVRAFIPDYILFIILILYLYKAYDKWRLNLPIYTIVILSLLLHSAGVFGWYHVSPIGWQWDLVTHFFGLMAWAMFFFNYARPWLEKTCWTTKNVRIFILVVLAAMGIGAAVEMVEFFGYLSFGFGDGVLKFGPGDGVSGLTGQELISSLGGGWINENWDLTFNMLGALMGAFIMIMLQFYLHVLPKPKK